MRPRERSRPVTVALIGAGAVIVAALIGYFATSHNSTQITTQNAEDAVNVPFETSYSYVGGFVPQCPCIAYSKDEKGLTVTNKCSGPVPIMCVKDTGYVQTWDAISLVPGRQFAHTTIGTGKKAFFDTSGMVGNRGVCQFYACPGTDNQVQPLRCQVGIPQPPPAAACLQGSGFVGQSCTCPNGATGILTQ